MQKVQNFEEEKNVFEKAPIDGIKIIDHNNEISKDTKILSDENFFLFNKSADFIIKKSTQSMIKRIKSETSLSNIKLIELSKTNFRVLLGPFNDINSLKESFEKNRFSLF